VGVKVRISAIVLILHFAGSPPALRAQQQLRAQEPNADRPAVVVASKPFGESYVLAEMFAQLLEANGIRVERRPALGQPEIAFGALRRNAIDVYPEYTGTGLLAILHDELPDSIARDSRAVFSHVATQFAERFGTRWLPPLGFENTYAIAVRRETAERHGLRTLSDLARASPQLTAGFSADFIGRRDGLSGLAPTYGMRLKAVRPLSPALKYRALAAGEVDVIDGYATDGLLARYDLVVLEDDRKFFPPYDAAALVSARLARDRPDAIAALTLLSGRLSASGMRELNRRVEVDGEEVASVARDALRHIFAGSPTRPIAPRQSGQMTGRALSYATIGRLALRHLLLVVVALGTAALIGIPLGLALERRRRASEATLGVLGVVQTIPSIALLAFMLPLFGVGVVPALVALFLYAMYPIVRGTYVGVRDADADAVEAADALGVTPAQVLRWVRLPLATPAIMSGVRTAAIITVGAATLAAFIGAGGLGEPIVQGLALVDTSLVLSGAIPAALLAVLVDGVLWMVERRLRPAHLRKSDAAWPWWRRVPQR
jgi:osmoprotectant transport system permease protein